MYFVSRTTVLIKPPAIFLGRARNIRFACLAFAISLQDILEKEERKVSLVSTTVEQRTMSLETLLEAAKIIESRSKGKHVVFCNTHVGACLHFNLLSPHTFGYGSYCFSFSLTLNELKCSFSVIFVSCNYKVNRSS